jgi:lipid intermediate transporter
MPICTSCTHPIPYLYTVYESAYNLRLEQCVRIGIVVSSTELNVNQNSFPQTECHTFADPYVEHDTLIIVLDLILMKRAVYRHLLYNRGSEPRKASGGNQKKDSSDDDEKEDKEKRDKERLKMTDKQREKVRGCTL